MRSHHLNCLKSFYRRKSALHNQICVESDSNSNQSQNKRLIKSPYYIKGFSKDPYNRLKEDEIKNFGDASFDGPRLYDYRKIAEIVNRLPTIKEKIDFVNPFERSWIQPEKTWHRKWLPGLLVPRKAWGLPKIPEFYDVLNFYKYITKTHFICGQESKQIFDDYYSKLDVSPTTFEERVSEVLKCYLWKSKEEEEISMREEESDLQQSDSLSDLSSDNITEFLRTLIEDALLSLAKSNKKFHQCRVSHTPRFESFWIRSGFRSLYKCRNIWDAETRPRKTRITGDDRRRLGELTFTMRDEVAVNIRSSTPTKNVFDWFETEKLNAPVFEQDFDIQENVIYFPKMLKLFPDPEILFQCPGYDYDVDEPCKFGRLAVKNISLIRKRIEKHWKPSDDNEYDQIKNDSIAATAISSLFNWLNGQAHCIGHTQYTDIQSPLTSQLILSDGKDFYFALGQLNTIAINIDVQGFINDRSNFCCIDGPYNLFKELRNGAFYHEDDKGELQCGLNGKVLEMILKCCIDSR